jgi:ADP-ribosylation factor-like protein 4
VKRFFYHKKIILALYRMKFDQYLNTVPTIGFNCEKIKGENEIEIVRERIRNKCLTKFTGNVGRAKGVSFLVWGEHRQK